MPTVELTGHDLTIDQVEAVSLAQADVTLSQTALDQIGASRDLIERVVAERIPTYGVNTGFGRFVDVHIEPEQTTALQLNLLRSHACGVGDPFGVDVVRAATLLRANALAKGSSGVRLETVQLLLDLLRPGCIRWFPPAARWEQAATWLRSPTLPWCWSARALPRSVIRCCPVPRHSRVAGLEPLELGAKEGLALINGTQFMAAIGALALCRARRLVKIADLAAPSRSKRCAGRAHRLLPSCRRCGPIPARSRRPPISTGCWTTPRSSPRTAGAGGCRTPTRCAARHRYTVRCATP